MIGASHSVPLAIAYERRGTHEFNLNHRVFNGTILFMRIQNNTITL